MKGLYRSIKSRPSSRKSRRSSRKLSRLAFDDRNLPVVRRRQHLDRCARMIRHSDGIKDIALKIKEKALGLVEKFKQLSGGQKIALALTKIVKLLAALYAAKTANDIRKDIQLINGWKSQTIQLANEWEKPGLESSADSLKKKIFLKQGLKVVLGLVTALVAASKEKVIKAGLPEGYGANGAE